MSITRKRALLASLLLACILSYLGAQSNLVRIAYLSLGYERTLDNYSQIDTTVTDVSATAGPAASNAVLLSAFFGLDDALPLMASRVICEGAAGKDGMPVVFSHELNVQTVQPGDFKITATSGSVGKVTCLTLAPADDPGELRTVLLIGQYGSIHDQPETVEIVGNVLSKDNSLNFKGASVAVTPLENGPSLVAAEFVPQTEWMLDHSGSALPFGGGTGCPTGTRQVVRVTWEGGVTKPNGKDADAVERDLYEVTYELPTGSATTRAPFALADLGDGDNNHKLCLNSEDAVKAVSFPAGYLTDPRNDPNPATSVSL